MDVDDETMVGAASAPPRVVIAFSLEAAADRLDLMDRILKHLAHRAGSIVSTDLLHRALNLCNSHRTAQCGVSGTR